MSIGNESEGPDERISVRDIVVYGLPVGAVMYANFLIASYFMKFATDVLLVAPVAVGTIFLIGRVWDAINDPIIGQLSDRTRTRWGRRRPWFFASALPLSLCLLALWAPPALEGSALTLWLTGAFLLFLTFYSTFRVPHLALGAEMSRGYHDRTRVFAGSQLIEGVGILTAAGTIALLESSDAARQTASHIAWVMSAVIALVMMGTAIAMRERPEHQTLRDGHPPLAVFKQVLANPHARILIAAYFLDQAGFTIVIAGLPYLSDWVLHTPGSTAIYLGTAVIAMIGSIPLWVSLAPRFGKRRLLVVALSLRCAALLGLFLMPEEARVLFFAGILIVGATSGATSVLKPSLQSDVIDWDAARSGARREGAYFATWNFAQKSAAGLAGWLLGIALTIWGYSPELAEQTEGTVLGIRVASALVPFFLSAASLLVLMRFQIDEASHARLLTQLPGSRES